MSVYPPPERNSTIFNPADFSELNNYLTTSSADATYAKLAGGQTITAQETFAGGVKTASIVSSSGELEVTGNVTSSNLTNFLLPIGASLRIANDNSDSSSQKLRLYNTGTDAYIDWAGTGGNLYFRSGTTLGIRGTVNSTGWSLTNVTATVYKIGSVSTFATTFGNSATSHTVTSSDLSWLSTNNWAGELKLFADNTSTNQSGIHVVYLYKPSTTLYLTAGSKGTNMTTFEATVASNVSLTVTTKVSSTDTTGCRLAWIFTGAQ